MAKEIIGFINKNNDIFNLKDNSSASYCCKVGQGHENKIAVFTEDGNLKDSGAGIDAVIEEGNTNLVPSGTIYNVLQGKVDKVENAVAGNLASLDADGNLQDSGKKPADFAEVDHEHNYIAGFSGSGSCGASISVGENEQGAGGISLYVKGDGQSTNSKTAKIDYYSIDNLNRALEAPDDTPASGSDNLITSNAVYGALSGKASSSSVNSLNARIDLLESYLLTNKCTIQVDITIGYDGTNYYYIIKNGGNNVVSAFTAEYVTLQNIDDIFRLAKTGDTIGITTRDGKIILSGTISEKSLGTIKVSSAFDDQYVKTFSPGTGELTLSVSTQS